MFVRNYPVSLLVALSSLVMLMTGCGDKTFFVAGNTASMVVACVLFWSTLKLNRHSVKPAARQDELE